MRRCKQRRIMKSLQNFLWRGREWAGGGGAPTGGAGTYHGQDGDYHGQDGTYHGGQK